MGVMTFGGLLALVTKLAVGIAGTTGIVKGVSWFNKASFTSKPSKRAGALRDLEHEIEKL